MAPVKLQSRLTALFLLLAALMSAIGIFTAWRLQEASSSLDSIYKDRVACQQQLRIVEDAYTLNVAASVRQVRDGTLAPQRAAGIVETALRNADRQWAAYLGTYLTPEEAKRVGLAQPALAKARTVALEAQRLLGTGDRPGLDTLASRELPAAFDALSASLAALQDLQVDISRQADEHSHHVYAQTLTVIVTLVAAALLLGGALTATTVVRYTRETRAHEIRLQRLTDFYWTLSRTNQLIVREVGEARLLDELCRICVENGHARLAVINMREGDRVFRAAHAGPVEEFHGGLVAEWDLRTEPFRHSAGGRSMLTGRPAVINDFQREAPVAAWRQRAKEVGVGSVASVALLRGGSVIGSLVLYAAEKEFFDEQLLQLLDEMASDISFALDNFDREAERLAARAQTSAHLERFRQLFNAAPVTTYIATIEDGTMLEVNDIFCERYGTPREAIIGHRLPEFGLGLSDESFQMFTDALRREGKVRSLELQTWLPGDVLATVLTNADLMEYEGRPCLLAMSVDVTDLRQAERAREAGIAAEAANQAKTAFLSHISHELRTPLNAILGFTQLMVREDTAERSRQDATRLEVIHRSSLHLLSLVNDLLDISRIEAGSVDVQRLPVPLAPLLDEVWQIIEPLAAQAGVELRDDFRQDVPAAVLADPIRLRQSLINLLTNAIKYNRRGGSVRMLAGLRARQVSIEVSDTGIGMSAAQLQHLYEPFNRLGQEGGVVEGTGLGLALTRQLVRLMEGELEIESQPGVGSTARVILSPALAPGADPQAPIAPSPRQQNSQPRGIILYIEDNDINVMLVEAMLAPWSGVRLVHAPNGSSGIEQARHLQPDLILLDMQLPDMTGIDILRALAADELTRGLRVVATSASAMPQEVEQARRNGVLDYWTKPLDVNATLDGLARLLSPGPAESAAAAEAAEARV